MDQSTYHCAAFPDVVVVLATVVVIEVVAAVARVAPVVDVVVIESLMQILEGISVTTTCGGAVSQV